MADVDDRLPDGVRPRWLEGLGRFGNASRGILFLVMAGLVLGVARGGGGQDAGATGALQEVAEAPLGTVALLVVALGFAAYAVIRAVHVVVVDDEAEGLALVGRRLVFATHAVAYGLLAVYAVMIALGIGGASSGGSGQTTSRVLSWPAGTWLVGAVGVGVLATGVALAVAGGRREFAGVLRDDLTDRVRRPLVVLGAVGHVLRGVAFALVGWFLLVTAVTHDPDQGGGLDQALREVAEEPFGTAVLIGIAVGFAAYGLFFVAVLWAGRTREPE
ncbi:DUF1206 domain-containing protein [Euzebya sp.]|uniref:DUF1206 domain-containing protein n=1 Tax=Euzebya sp. TaxID=1971409 RepID=UPI0035140844